MDLNGNPTKEPGSDARLNPQDHFQICAKGSESVRGLAMREDASNKKNFVKYNVTGTLEVGLGGKSPQYKDVVTHE